MTATEAIRARRSVRKFKSGVTIPKEQIDMLLEAAMLAPSACNSRPWEFIVITDRAKLDAIVTTHPFTKMLKTASLAIVVCALPDAQNDISAGFFPQDCGAAAQNILLQAVDLGLGGCWCGVYPKEDKIAGMRGIVDTSGIPFCVIAIGVPDESPAQRGSYDASKVRYL